jgi:alkanesulfonate monooxygenase SsuD/methylene tetrahydromethanopterin reductase-like flavin-dependent oxidoreductase (luciferase family)
VTSVPDMKRFRDDVRERMIDQGRKPDECKILFLASPILAETDTQAREEEEQRKVAAWSPSQIEQALWYMSYQSGGDVDFGSYDLDSPMPQVTGNGEQSVIEAYVKGSEEKTLREIAATRQLGNVGDLVGSPDTVAAKMGEIMEEVGGDGFILYCDMTRRSISAVTDGLAPALRRRGLIRHSYDDGTFRDNLLAF